MYVNKLTASAFVAALAAAPAGAQSIDYGSLEMLFGEPVTTSATGAPQRSTDAPVTMEIISAEDIRKSGATDLPGVLSRVVGVGVQRFSRSTADVSVRGYNQSFNPRLLVLVNGRQVYLDYYGYTNWDVIPVQLEEIRQIEIVKGPNTALFGFNATSGVVNIITYNPTHDDVQTANVRVDQDGGYQASGVAAFKPHEKLGVKLSVGGYEVDELEDLTTQPTYLGSGENERLAVAGEAVLQVTSKVQAAFEATHSELDTYDRVPNSNLTPNTTDYETTSYRGAVEAEGSFGLLKATAYRNEVDFGIATPTGAQIVENELTLYKVEDLFKIGANHTFRIAGEYRDGETTFGAVGGVAATEVTAFSGMWNWAATDKISTTLALRSDQFEYTVDTAARGPIPAQTSEGDRDVFSYNAGIVFKATDEDTLRFQVSEGTQVPSQINLIINPDLEPTTVQNYGVDWDRALPVISGAFRASVFYQTNEDMPVSYNFAIPTPAGVQFASILDNVGDSDLTGLELSLNGIANDRFQWDASYTYLSPEDTFAPVAAGTAPLDYESTIPTSEAKVSGRYETGKWSLGAAARYVSDHAAMEAQGLSYVATDIDAYTALDARIAFNVRDNVVLAVEGQDITNENDIQVPNGAIESRFQFSLTADF